MSYAYTTVGLVQAELQTATEFSSSTLPTVSDIEEWIAEESAYINGIANTVFGSTLYSSEFIDYDGSGDLILENSPLISVTSVQYNNYPLGSALGTSWTTKTLDTDYTVYSDRGIVRLLEDRWTPDPGNKRFCVTYSAGYTTVPYNVRKLATKLVAERVLSTLLQKNINERNDGGSISVGSISIVEPSSYGVASFKQLKADIDALKQEIISKQTGVFRLAHI